MSGERCRPWCIVDRCPNHHRNRKRNNKEVKFYPFPDDAVLKTKWIEILSLFGNWTNNEKNANICSVHFLASDFELNEVEQFVLKRHSIPSVNLDLLLADNEVVVNNIASTKETFNVGVLRNETRGLKFINKNPEDIDLPYDFLSALKKSFLNTEYCNDYNSQLITTCTNDNFDDNSLNNVITSAKKNQINSLKNLKFSTKAGIYNYKQRLYLYTQEEKNRTYAKLKTRCFGRCRLCLYCFKNSDLLLLSGHFIGDKDVIIRDYLMSLFPSLSDNFQSNHEICIICYEHLLVTLHFFKMTLSTEGILNTILKNQPFIFNEKQETETVVPKGVVNLEKENKNTSTSCCNDILYSFSDMENDQEDSTPIEPILSEAPRSLLNNSEDTKNGSLMKECYEKNKIIDNLEVQQKDDLVSLEVSTDNVDPNNEFSDIDEYKQVPSYLLGLNKDNEFSEPQENQLDQTNTESETNVIPCNYLADLPQTDSFVSVPATVSDLSHFIEDASLSQIHVVSLKESKMGKVILLGKDDFSLTNESDCHSSSNNSHLQDIVNIKSDAETTNPQEPIKCEETDDESNDLTDTDQYKEQNDYVNIKCKDLSTLINDVNSEDTYATNDVLMTDNSRDEQYSIDYVSSAHSGVDGNTSVTESILRSTLQKKYCLPNSLTVITPPIINTEDLDADFSENLQVISLDFNMAKEKRIIFLGGMYCKCCMKTRGACRQSKYLKRRVICEKCGKRLSAPMMRWHSIKCEPNLSFSCDKCKATFSTKSKYEYHLKEIADAPVCNYLKCKVCLVKLTEADFKEHIKEHPNYLCQICGKSFMYYKQLYHHVRRHGQDYVPKQEPYVVCQFCGKLFTRGHSLYYHLKGHARQKQGKKESCDICNKKFYTTKDVQKHKLLTHTGNKYPCDHCDKLFASPACVKNHFQVVHMKKPVATCEICNREFVRHDSYRYHMRRHHAGNGPSMARSTRVPLGGKSRNNKNSSRYKCRLCDMTFHSLANKGRHEKLHKNPYYQFSCKICHARHKSEKQLREHTKKSHSKKPNKIYQCYQCNEKFNKKYFLLHHIRNAHSKELTEDKEPLKT